MKKGLSFALILLAFVKNVKGQIVPNGDFEYYSSCPTSLDQLNLASPWFKANSGSSDYHNECGDSTSCGVPYNYGGYQFAHSGVGYAGIVLYNWPWYREYLEVPLNAPLQAGKSYLFQMYINAANNCQLWSGDIGSFFRIPSFILQTLMFYLWFLKLIIR